MKKNSGINKIIFIVFLACVFFTIGFSAIKYNWASTSNLNEETSITIHYYNFDNWSNPYIYYYSDNHEGEPWPGTSMNRESGNWYVYEITGCETANVIFSDAGNNQVPGQNEPGFPVTGDKWYYNGTWYDENPLEAGDDSSVKVHFYNYNDWDNAYIYYYGEGDITPEWPGTAMNPEGDGWFEYEITGIRFPKVIFNDSQRNQIPEKDAEGFTVTQEVWYRNGIAYENRPSDIVVNFYKPGGWGEPYIYYYISDTDTGPVWPGMKMDAMGDGWYKYIITKYSEAKVLFSDGVRQIPEAEQEGFEVTGTMWYKDGIWYHKNPNLPEGNPLTGDLNGDGVVDQKDLDLLDRFLAGEITLTEEQKKFADTNGDGVVDDKDRDTLEQYINGETTEAPKEDETEEYTERTVSYEYDKLGRVIKAVYDSENYVEYSYDKNGNITDIRVTGNID